MKNKQVNLDFVREQYSQYWEMARTHSSYSWQLSTTAIVAIIAFIALDTEMLTTWTKTPLIPAFAFLVVGMFTITMLINLQRNLLFTRYYEQAITQLEEEFGKVLEVHHHQIAPNLKGWRAISSSKMLSVFLLLITIGILSMSIYFFVLAF